MLVVSRKKNESILLRVKGLSEPIRIMVTAVRGANVQIGIEAHRDSVEVVRSELLDTVPSFQEIPDGVDVP